MSESAKRSQAYTDAGVILKRETGSSAASKRW